MDANFVNLREGLIDAELVGNMSQAAIARFLGVSREIISREVQELEKALGFHGSGQKTIEQRKQFSAARMRHWAEREHQRLAKLN